MTRRVVCLFAALATMAWGQEKPVEPPVKNVELTVYMLSGVTQAGSSDDVPQDLAGTVKQLHSLFNYKGYRLAESFILRGRSSAASSSARTRGDAAGIGRALQLQLSTRAGFFGQTVHGSY